MTTYLAADDYSVPADGNTPAGNALNALLGSAAKGAAVLLRSGGKYLIDKTVNLPANTELRILSGARCVAAAGLNGPMFASSGTDGVAITGDGVIDGNLLNQTSGSGVVFTSCTAVQIGPGITVTNCYTDGVALVGCSRARVTCRATGNGRHGIYHSGSTFCSGSVVVRDNGQRVAGSGLVFDAASTDNSYAPVVATDTRVGGAKTQVYGVFEVAASGCDRNALGASALTGNATGPLSLIGASSGVAAGVPLPGSVTDVSMAVHAFAPLGLTGSVAPSRYVGATTSGPPTTGPHLVGDWIVDTTAVAIWVCTAPGTPGTWGQVGPPPDAFAVKAAAYPMVATDRVIIQTAAAAVTLPAANAVVAGYRVEIKSTIAAATIVRAGADTIWSSAAAQTSLTLGAGDSYSLRSDSVSVWYVVA